MRRTIPRGGWGAPAVGALILCSALSAGAEAGWRARGQRATADPEDVDLWAAERRRASSGSEKTLVILGKSRALLGVDGATLRRRYPDHTVVQLAVKGRSGFAAFEDLARDPAFRGRVLFELSEPDLHRDNAKAQLPEVTRAKTAGPDAAWNARIRAFVASHLAVRSHQLFPKLVFERALAGAWPAATFVITEPDRFTHADFPRANLDVITADILGPKERILRLMGDLDTPNEPWRTHMLRVAPLVEALHQKGGDVAFVHLPVSGRSLAFSERVYPKARFWDELARAVPGHALHFRDVDALRGFTCPDTSHLDERDAAAFTAALFQVLEQGRLMPTGSGAWR